MSKKILVVWLFFSLSFIYAIDFGKVYYNAEEPMSIVFFENHTIFNWALRGI